MSLSEAKQLCLVAGPRERQRGSDAVSRSVGELVPADPCEPPDTADVLVIKADRLVQERIPASDPAEQEGPTRRLRSDHEIAVDHRVRQAVQQVRDLAALVPLDVREAVRNDIKQSLV